MSLICGATVIQCFIYCIFTTLLVASWTYTKLTLSCFIILYPRLYFNRTFKLRFTKLLRTSEHPEAQMLCSKEEWYELLLIKIIKTRRKEISRNIDHIFRQVCSYTKGYRNIFNLIWEYLKVNASRTCGT